MDDVYDSMVWLRKESGIGFQSIGYYEDGNNKYILSNGQRISHETLMGMLRERFPD